MINGIIQVPESPETEGFVSTSLKDIKAADPGSEITLISPPTANNEGNAELTYPIKLPKGRSQMQPELSLVYNSDASSGWAGLGWGISIPSISVDVIWGVPRYLADLESETYVMGGTQLSPVAHRSDYVARTSEKRFYSRKEENFDRIMRHGDSPQNYWWEVTSKEGVSNYFGGSPETGVISNAVSMDGNGNVGYWALVKTVDLHKNYVEYTYEKPIEGDQQIYISEITYTGYNTEEGSYKISFLKNDEENTYERKDARVNARFGYIQRDIDLLRRINISYNDEPVRSYSLQYSEGAFSKTLLYSITEYDAAGNEFYTHQFDYYNDIAVGTSLVPYDLTETKVVVSDNLNQLFINPINWFFDDVSALGTSESIGGQGGVSVTIGPNDWNLSQKSNTVGGSISFQYSTNKGQICFIDLNGDRLPDKVFKQDDKLYYRKNLLTYPNDTLFGERKLIDGINTFSESSTIGVAIGLEAHPPVVFVGYNGDVETTLTDVYFEDFNADGLMDIVKGGTVYFNYMNTEGDPVFSTSSALTPNPLYANSDIATSMLPNPEEEQAAYEEKFPLHDAVKAWQAPYTGRIVINAPANLVEDTTEVAQNDTAKDGVKLFIQFNGTNLWTTEIDGDDYTARNPVLDTLTINKGERLYFRVNSRFNGSYDKVHWDPEIIYTTIDGSDTLPGFIDVNKRAIGFFKASEDFVLCGQQSLSLPKTGRIKISTAFSKLATSDTVRIDIIRTESNGIISNLYSREYNCLDLADNDSINQEIDVTDGDVFEFKVISSTNIDWSVINWGIYAEYTSLADSSALSVNGVPIYSFQSVPNFSKMFNNPVRHALPIALNAGAMTLLGLNSGTTDPQELKVLPQLSFGDTSWVDMRDNITLAVKSNDTIFGEKTYNTLIPIMEDTLTVNVKLGDTVYFEYSFSDIFLGESNITTNVLIGSAPIRSFGASAYSAIDPADEIFGKLYRGWGQFDYNGNDGRDTLPIDESLLTLPDNYNENVGDITDTSGLNGTNNPMDGIFNIMVPYAKNKCYLGTDEYVYVSKEHVSSSRLGMKDIAVTPMVFSASGLNAPRKVCLEVVNSVSLGAGVGSISGSLSGSLALRNQLVDMMDMNGDMYPDLVSTDRIQYTGVKGALEGAPIDHSLGDQYSIGTALGVTAGGSFIEAKTSNSQAGNKAEKRSENAQEAQETADNSVSVTGTGSFSSHWDYTDQTWMDINGDGLPDKLYNNGDVRLNLGYSFAPVENWGFDTISTGRSWDLGGGLGVNIGNGSIEGGVGISQSINYATQTFLDINSDGLSDIVRGNTVLINTGSGFASPVVWDGLDEEWPGIPLDWANIVPLNAGKSVGESANGAFTVGVVIPTPLPGFTLKLCINPSANVTHGISNTLTQISDIDGDGWPDVLSSDKENEMKIKLSRIKYTNLLKSVEQPMGSRFSLDYVFTPATYEHPGGKIALASVEVYDGLTGDGADTMRTSIEYEGGYYDRQERSFYGFEYVKTNYLDTENNDSPYRSVEQQFSISNYYTKGMLLNQTIYDGQGRKLKGTHNSYSLRDINTGTPVLDTSVHYLGTALFVALDETDDYAYGGAINPRLSTRVTYTYDTYGNISGYTDYSSGNENDRYTVTIQYHNDDDNYIHSIPSQQEVTTIEELKRRNETSIDEFGNTTQIRKYVTADQSIHYDMEYDEYGNLTKITHPENYQGERMWYEYEYDSAVHCYVTQIADAYGYSSTTEYDYKWGMPVEVTDLNNQKMEYTFDDCGRMQTITGPYELDSGRLYTIAFEYHPEASVPYARSLHYDPVYGSDIEIYSFADGLSRPVQIKKTAQLFEGADQDDAMGYIVSGKIILDAFGRATETYQPVFEAAGNGATYNSNVDEVAPTIVTYNVMDSIIYTILPDGSVTNHSFGIRDYNGEAMFFDSLTDALNHLTITYTKANGLQAATIMKTNAGDITTNFRYNALGALVSTTDPLGNITSYEYDMLGRHISIDQPDAGLTELTYDGAGNLTQKITANLRKKIPNGGAITYKYDHERLVEIVYPRNVQNRINYTYGEPGAKFNRAGRVVLIEDVSGGQEFFYSPLGQIIKTIRTVQLGLSDMRTWIWSATYDTWDRVQTITYPDGEKVTYSYNRAGNLTQMNGEKLGRTYEYISRIGYNKFEKQTFLEYGNGAITTYDFEPERQRLSQMTITSNDELLMDNNYTYDAISNILTISNNATPTGKIGGFTSHSYSYDDLYRLTQASGTFTGNVDSINYILEMQYDIMGKILQKNQQHYKNGEVLNATTYDLGYKYQGVQPSVATEIGSRVFSYDDNGNQTGWIDTVSNDYRQICWDEENRITLISDNGYYNMYVYDADGERVIKSHGGTQGVYINGAPTGIINHCDDNYTVYVSPYFVLKNDKFTKHYYNGGTRVASKIGNGRFQNQYRLSVFEITAGSVDYINRQQQLQGDKNEYIRELGIPPGPPTSKGIYADPEYTGTAFPDGGTPDTVAPRGWPRNNIYAPPGGPPGAPVQWGNEITNDNVLAGFGFVGTGSIAEHLSYFYHSNQLGSSVYITNFRGNVTQYIAYLPFGEILAEQHSDWDSPNKFNAMELDVQTGLYYYGERYYDPKVSLWLGVDPMAEKYPFLSPFVYAANSPTNALDPDGRIIIFVNGRTTQNNGSNTYWDGFDNTLGNLVSATEQMVYVGGSDWIGSSAKSRMKYGEQDGFERAAEIFGEMLPTETIKIFTHSMGGAWGKGFIKGLQSYYEENENLQLLHGGRAFTDMVDFELDFAPYQAGKQEIVPGITTGVISHYYDPLSHTTNVIGAEQIVSNVTPTLGDKLSGKGHKIVTFANDLDQIEYFIQNKTFRE